MATQSAYTTVTLRRLPQGESLQITISSNKSMTILKDTKTGAETPPISSTNKLVLTPGVYGTSGQAAALSNVTWTMDDQDVLTVTGLGASVETGGVLNISASPIGKGSKTTIHSIVFKFKAKATLSKHTYDVEKSIVLNCSETSQNSYWGSIEASNGTTLDETTKQTVLTPILHLGTDEVASTYTVKWFKTGAGALDAGTGIRADLELTQSNMAAQHVTLTDSAVGKAKTLTVTRDAVNASAHFEAHFFVGANEVEAEGVSIVDVADEMQIEAIPDQYVEKGGTATFTIRAYNSKKNNTQIDITNVSQLSVTASDSIRRNEYTVGTEGTKQVVTSIDATNKVGKVSMKETNLYVPNPDSGTRGDKPWIQVGDAVTQSAAQALDASNPLEGGATHTWDTPVTEGEKTAKATECEVILTLGAEIEM